MKTIIGMAMLAALAMQSYAQAELIAGWDSWDETAGSQTPASATSNGVTGTVSFESITVGGQVVSFGSGQGSSADGTYGTIVSPAASTVANIEGASMALANGTNGFFDFQITNSGPVDLVMSTFEFDALRTFSQAADSYSLDVQSGGLTLGNVVTETGVITDQGSITPTTEHEEFVIGLDGLADSILAVGESATLRLTLTGGNFFNGGNNLYIDNVGITASAVPEPSSWALLGVAGVYGVVRRRRKTTVA